MKSGVSIQGMLHFFQNRTNWLIYFLKINPENQLFGLVLLRYSISKLFFYQEIDVHGQKTLWE